MPLLSFPLLQDVLDCIDTDDHTVAMIGINTGIVRVCFGYSDWLVIHAMNLRLICMMLRGGWGVHTQVDREGYGFP